ncbi:copper chaperone PCu(A)C [Devosia submarina]|uniref:copper chaperone PCu(A)C n=1 Tax=Devosia submarina TaxID=1173082 RepID=UPI0013005F3B|nr:copper chaperone PCu(A)C [Devosia submarina]
MHKIVIAAFLAFAPTAQAHDFTAGTIFIDHPMIEEAPPNAPVIGGYVTLHNNGGTDDRLIQIESSAAEKVEIHKTTVTDGIARMQPLTEGLTIPAGDIVWLGDDGTHAMFVKPAKRYQVGDEVPATLVFEKAGRIDITFKVEERSLTDGPGHEGHGQ